MNLTQLKFYRQLYPNSYCKVPEYVSTVILSIALPAICLLN